jgi:serine/threonine protein phosphatase PrpC
MSDGVWTQLSLTRLAEIVARSAMSQLPDLPERILLGAGRTGASDDMTVVVARVR